MAPKASKLLIPIALGLSACGLSAYLIYLYFKREEYDSGTSVSSNLKISKIKVPKEAVAAIIGRGGSNIKEVQEKSGTHVHFQDEILGENERVCVIQGSNEDIQLAKLLIEEIVANMSLIQSSEIWVPQKSCGRIIGRCGENVQKISRNSNAKVFIDPPSNQDPSHDRRIVITGTLEQIEVAKSLIEAKVIEDAELRQTLAQRQPRGKPRSPLPAAVPTSSSKSHDTQINSKLHEKLATTGQIDGQIEVYVSAVEDPGKFWVQIVGPKANELDQLVEQMTDYYSKPENCELHRLESVSIGEIVAAVFQFDSKWYRAEVVDIKKDIDSPSNMLVELYFVDYGDSDIVKRSEVYELRTDFLHLRFQAIECFLAKVGPKDGIWSVEATDLFENITQVAQWKKMMSKIVTYRERDASNSNGRARREGSPIPGIELYDNTKSGDINVADELVKNGFAIYEKDVITSPGTSTKSLSDRFPSENREVIPVPSVNNQLPSIDPKLAEISNKNENSLKDTVKSKENDILNAKKDSSKNDRNIKPDNSVSPKSPTISKEKPRVDFSPKFLKTEKELPRVTSRKQDINLSNAGNSSNSKNTKQVQPNLNLSYSTPKATEYSSSDSEEATNGNIDANMKSNDKVLKGNGKFARGDNVGLDSMNNLKDKKTATSMMLDLERSGGGDFDSTTKKTNEDSD